MPQIWLTSDTHFGHDLVSGLRGFETVEKHDAAILRSWNKQVRPQDIVYHLGDVFLGTPTIDLSELNGTIHLITGNHDGVHPGYRRPSPQRFDKYHRVFSTIQQFAELRYQGERFALSHYPYEGEGRDQADRDTQWRLPDMGLALIHGHTHSPEKYSESSARTPQLHVGWDAWRRPVRIHELLRLMEDAPLFGLRHLV